MRFAAIADIHGNIDALNAVLADISDKGITDIVNLGDVFSGPLAAGRVADRLMPLAVPTVRGNHDRYLLTQRREDMGPSDAVAHDQLTAAQRDWLADLPPVLEPFPGVLMCHATPENDETYLLETLLPDGTLRHASAAEIRRRLGEVSAAVILTAHTHLPRAVRLNGQLIVNPGSVGCPAYTDDHPLPHKAEARTPDASYAILEKAEDWRVSFLHVPYDTTAMCQLARNNGRHEWVEAVETGWIPSFV